MRTIYLGDTYRHNADHKQTGRMSQRQVDAEREPRGRNMPVFDRRATGGRDDFERDWQDDDETVLVRRGGYGSQWRRA